MLSHNQTPQKTTMLTKIKRRIARIMPFIEKFKILLIILFVFFIAIKIFSPLSSLSQKIIKGPGIIFSLIINSGSLKQENGKTNFLLLGIGGGSHEGPNLTDTIIFASVNNKTGETLLLSIPRDIWIESLKQKVNTAYTIGETKKKGGGIILAKSSVSEVTGQPIHYGVVVNFDVFEKAIDLVGGIDVYVERTFDDFKYPKEGKNWEVEATESGDIYEHLHFSKGWMHMDGKTALKYARSRYSEDPDEGTDFARSKRQQKIIIAFKDKLLSKQTLFDIPKIVKTINTFRENIDTDINENNLSKLVRLALKFDEKKLRTVIIDEGTEEKPGFLINPPAGVYESWVLVPRSGSWIDFQKYLKKELEKDK